MQELVYGNMVTSGHFRPIVHRNQSWEMARTEVLSPKARRASHLDPISQRGQTPQKRRVSSGNYIVSIRPATVVVDYQSTEIDAFSTVVTATAFKLPVLNISRIDIDPQSPNSMYVSLSAVPRDR